MYAAAALMPHAAPRPPAALMQAPRPSAAGCGGGTAAPRPAAGQQPPQRARGSLGRNRRGTNPSRGETGPVLPAGGQETPGRLRPRTLRRSQLRRSRARQAGRSLPGLPGCDRRGRGARHEASPLPVDFQGERPPVCGG